MQRNRKLVIYGGHNFYGVFWKTRLSPEIHRFYSKAAPDVKRSKWHSVVGLEVHCQIASNSKLFSGSATSFSSPLNSSVSLFDAAIPGTLPVLNKRCVEDGVKTALALECRINEISMFDRKHYFYADLPAGYQITQQRAPLANDGVIRFPVFIPGVTKKPYQKTVRLHQLQLEQDSGKSLHDDSTSKSLIDLNRAGIPLMELVFEPDLENGEEAAALIKELILILQCLGTCSCKMEEGGLRVDANVSIHEKGQPLGTRTEIKNIGSVRNVAQAVAYEINRQIKEVESGKKIHNETRSWDSITKRTIAMRDKEVQQDYRFMPEPNLLPLHLDIDGKTKSKDTTNVKEIQKEIPELPGAIRQKIISEYKLPEETAIILVNEPELSRLFFETMSKCKIASPKTISNLLINDILTLCNKNNINLDECKITSKHLGDILNYIQDETINSHIARLLLQHIQDDPGKSVNEFINGKNLRQINDPEEIISLCKNCMTKFPKMVEQYKSGKKKVIYALAGEIVKSSEQKANMAKVMKQLEGLLK